MSRPRRGGWHTGLFAAAACMHACTQHRQASRTLQGALRRRHSRHSRHSGHSRHSWLTCVEHDFCLCQVCGCALDEDVAGLQADGGVRAVDDGRQAAGVTGMAGVAGGQRQPRGRGAAEGQSRAQESAACCSHSSARAATPPAIHGQALAPTHHSKQGGQHAAGSRQGRGRQGWGQGGGRAPEHCACSVAGDRRTPETQ